MLDQATAVSERLLAQVSQGSLEVAFAHQVPVLATLPRVDWEVIRRGRLAVLLADQHPLAGRAALTLGQLSGGPVTAGQARLRLMQSQFAVTAGERPTP